MPDRKPLRTLPFLIIIVLVFTLFGAYMTSAQENGNAKDKTSGEKALQSSGSTISTLKTILDSIKNLQNRREKRKQDLENAVISEKKKEITEDIRSLTDQIDELNSHFEKIATGIDMTAYTSKAKEKFNWKQEAEDLIEPAIRELKNLTAKPRKVEKLRNEVAHYRNKLDIAENALSQIDELLKKAKSQRLEKELESLKNKWMDNKRQNRNQLSIARYQLNEIQKEKKSIFQSVQEVFRSFFKSRGRNLILSALAFVVVFLVMRLLHRLMYRITPDSRLQRRSFSFRLLEVIYIFMTFFGAMGAALVVLYVTGDWVLLSIAVIFLLGIAWTARVALPRFFEQIKLMLNFGSVREDEIVVYNGIPWRVVSINLYTRLENPGLDVEKIRLPINHLIGKVSRPYHENEPWFPCRSSDWVILSDDTFGKVISATPEMVQLEILGGSRKTYQTQEFLSLCPNNLSGDFRLRVTFGVDYQHQLISTTEIPDKLEKMLKERLTEEGYGEEIKGIRVEFKEAGASSLDVEILADFLGSSAKYYRRLGRLLQKISVDACNRYDWIIPFTQVTIHTATNPEQIPENTPKAQV